MKDVLAPATAYFAIVFAVGFVLGTVRVLLMQSAPTLGTAFAIAELPLMLWAAWRVCGVVVARFDVARSLPLRLTIGAVAFGLLMAAEAALGILAIGRTPAEHLASYAEPLAAAGLLAQIAFAAFPAVQNNR